MNARKSIIFFPYLPPALGKIDSYRRCSVLKYEKSFSQKTTGLAVDAYCDSFR